VRPTPTHQSSPRLLAGRLAIIALILAVTLAAAADDSPIPSIPSSGSISTEQLETAVNAIQARDGLDEETRSKVVDQLRDAQAQLQNRLAAESATAAFADALRTAPPETEKLRQQLNEPAAPAPTAASLGISSDMPVAEVEQMLSRSLAELAGAEARLADLDSQIAAQEERPARARARIAEIRQNREQLSAQIAAAAPPGEAAILTDARRLAAELRLDARTAELNRLEQELVSQGARLELLRAQRDITARSVARTRRQAEVLQAVVNDRRQSAATQALQDAALAELAAADKHPVIRTLAEGNADLTRRLPAIAADIERVTGELAAVEAQARQIEQAFARSVQRLEIGGVSQVIGRLFIEERRNLPQIVQYRAEVRERRRTLAAIGLEQVRIEEQRRDLTPLDASIEQALAEVAAGVIAPDELETIGEEIRQLLRNRRELLTQVAASYTSYIRALSDLDIAEQRLLDVADDYKQFLDGNLMWIPSASLFGIEAIRDLGPATAWLLSPRDWTHVLQATLESFREHAPGTIAAVLLLLLTVLSRRPLARRFQAINGRIGDLSTDHIGLTLAAVGIAAVRALPVPLALVLSGWALALTPQHSEFSAAVAWALSVVGPFLYNTLLFRVLCARDGVLQLHFGWGPERLPAMRRQLDRLTVVGVPIVFVAVLAYNSPIPSHRESLGRLAFIAMLAIIGGVVRALLHPQKGIAAGYYREHPEAWASRLRRLWYGLGAGVPLLLVVASLAGYLYTAGVLARELVATFWLVLGIVLANLVITRWIALTRHKLAWKRALLEQEQAALAETADADGLPQVPTRTPPDLDTVDQQTRRLVNVSLLFIGLLVAWGIWSDVLPALAVLEQVSLWSQTVTVEGQDTVVPVTLADLLLALVIIAVTAIATKNLPGLMEITVLQRMTLQPGSRYAINTLVRYVLITIGVITVLNIIGWRWSQIQWLVAALSVGLGFGLQEIVANFISGLIILFERPVRVGDTVTVGALSGKVTRVQIRATTITDWDRKEIIVPNKAFITEQVVNWTLSDPITRIVIPVGISYGSDVQLAHRVMEQTLLKLPLVLDDPPPKVYFVGFGDSSLNFDLHVFSRELADRLPLKHAVHEKILATLREHGIEIPFPQRDLHLRSVDANIKAPGISPGDDAGK
jgi:potassium efflux system protein